MEAGLVTSGCLNSVVQGKAYSKALFCIKTVTEAMERLLFESFVEEDAATHNTVALQALVKSCDRKTLDNALKDPSTIAILDQFAVFQDKVRKGHLGKTAEFWMSVINHTHLIVMPQFSVKTNNLALFHKCNGKMSNLFFAYDRPNYARYVKVHFPK